MIEDTEKEYKERVTFEVDKKFSCELEYDKCNECFGKYGPMHKYSVIRLTDKKQVYFIASNTLHWSLQKKKKGARVVITKIKHPKKANATIFTVTDLHKEPEESITYEHDIPKVNVPVVMSNPEITMTQFEGELVKTFKGWKPKGMLNEWIELCKANDYVEDGARIESIYHQHIVSK